MAAANIILAKKFGLDVRRFAKDQSEAGIVKAHRALTLIALTRIVLRTPVDTGRARNNWQVTSTTAATGVVGSTGTTSFNNEKERKANAAKAKNQALARAQGPISEIKAYSVVFLTNNVPYIRDLENGRSKRSPNGMVAVTLKELNAARIEPNSGSVSV